MQEDLLGLCLKRSCFLVLWAVLLPPDQYALGEVAVVVPQRNNRIGYVRQEIPAVVSKPWTGTRYQAFVPDTLDLCERARLALQGVLNLLDPSYDYELFWLAEFNRIPPVAIHQTLGPPWLDGENYKVMETIPLLRYVTGSEKALEADLRLRERTLHQIGPDGLAYWPEVGRPWLAMDVPEGGWKPVIGDVSQGQICSLPMSGRLIGTMTLYWLQDRDPVWKQTIEQMVDRLAELAVQRDDFAFVPASSIAPQAKVSSDMPMPTGNSWSCQPAWLIQGLAQYYRETQYEPARVLAEQLARYVMGPAGNFDDRGVPVGIDHLHHHTAVIMAVTELAAVTHNHDLARLSRRAYEQARRMGDSLVGFFPEGLRHLNEDGSYEYRYRTEETAETCEIADMIVSGLKLAELGYDDCWDDVDRWLRNQFAENQMRRADWIYRFLEAESVPAGSQDLPVRKKGEGRALYSGRPIKMPVKSPDEIGDRVPERHLGTFAGWPSANDYAFWDPQGHAILGAMHCCTANGSRTLYYAWDHILRVEDGVLRVNLLMNRASAWADVNSYIPYEGQVNVKIKKACRLEMRLPEWVLPAQASCDVNEHGRQLAFRGRYAEVGPVDQGDIVALTFPISERTLKTRIGGKNYTVIVKGNTVVMIDPPGKYSPLYQRTHDRENKVRWVERERFVADQFIAW